MKSIKIVSTSEDRDLSRIEKKDLFEDLQRQTNISPYHFRNLLCHAEVENPYQLKKTELIILDMKQLLHWVSPIFYEIPCRKISDDSLLVPISVHKKKRYISEIQKSKKYYIVLQAEMPVSGYVLGKDHHGGLSRKPKKKITRGQLNKSAIDKLEIKEKAKKGEENIIRERPRHAPGEIIALEAKKPDKLIRESNEYIAPPYTQFKIEGVELSLFDRYGKIMDLVHNRIPKLSQQIPINELLATGFYNLHSPNDVNYVNQYVNIDLPEYLSKTLKKEYIIFKNDDHVKSVIDALFKMVNDIQYRLERIYLSTIMTINSSIGQLDLKSFDERYKKNLHVISLGKKTSNIVDKLSKLYLGVISPNLPSNILHDLINGNLMDVYYMARNLGINHTDVRTDIDRRQKEMEENKMLQYHKFSRHKIDQKKAFTQSTSIRKFNKPWNDLNNKEKQLIELLFNKFINIQESTVFNCEHVLAINHMRWLLTKNPGLATHIGDARSRGTQRSKHILTSIKKSYGQITSLFNMKPYIFPDIKTTEGLSKQNLLSCMGCKIALLCPHFVTHMKLIINRKSEGFIRNFMLSTYAKIITNVDSAYYCRVCGEKIVASVDVSVFQRFLRDRRVPLEISDPLYDIVISEVAKSVNFISSTVIIDRRNIINQIASIIKPELETIEEQLMRSKTRDKENIKNSLRLYAYIYSFAFLVTFISANPAELEFTTIKKRKSRKKDLQELMKQAYILITDTKKSLIALIPGITPLTIKPLLIKAWRLAADKPPVNLKTLEEKYALEFTLALDPFYSYIHRVANYSRYGKKKINDTDFEFLLGKNLKIIKKNKLYVFQDIYVPNKPWDSSDWGRYIYNSYKLFARYMTELFKSVAIPLSLMLEEFSMQVNELKVAENLFHDRDKFARYKPYMTLPTIRRWIQLRKIYLGEIYCPSGIKHNFNIMVYRTPKGKTKEFSSEYIVQEIISDPKRSKEFKKYKLIDRRCSVCMVLESTITPRHDKKIMENLDRLMAIDGFYSMYESRCPKGGLHQFDEHKKCKKCGVLNKQLLSKDISYFNKYKKQYFAYIDQRRSKFAKEIVISQYDAKILNTMIKGKKFPKWKKSFAVINKWAKLSRISYNSLINLGLSEDIEYYQIEKGKINLYTNLTESKAVVRHIRLNNYLSDIFRTYQIIKNHDRIKLSIELQKILDNQSKNTIKGLSDFMPDIISNYYSRYHYYKYTELPSVLANYVLYTIASTIININEIFQKSIYKDMGMALVEYFNDIIIKAEKLFAKQDFDKQKIIVDVEKVDDDTYKDRMAAEDLESTGVDIDEIYDPFSAPSNLDIKEDDIEDDVQSLSDRLKI